MSILVFCNDPWHQKSAIKEGLSFLDTNIYSFGWIKFTADWSPFKLLSYSVAATFCSLR